MLWSHDLVMSLINYEFSTPILNWNCIGNTFDMQNIIKRGPILSLLFLYTTNAGLSIMTYRLCENLICDDLFEDCVR